MRKTVDVAALVDQLNKWIERAPLPAERRALAAVAEHVLFQADRYNGFQYLRSEFLPADQQTSTKVLRDDYDDTMRRYFVKEAK